MDSTKPLVVPITLKGSNYLLWARTLKTTICTRRGFWSHLVRERPPREEVISSEDEEDFMEEDDEWFMVDQAVKSIILSSLDPPILEAYSYCETAKDLWETLRKVYGNVSNLTRVFELKKSLSNLFQEEMEFTEYFGRFRSLWAELDMLRPMSIDPKVIRERNEEDKVFGLLMNLSPCYKDLVKHILRSAASSQCLPSLEEVCAQIQKEQGSSELFDGKGSNALIMASKAQGKVEDRRKLFCEHCKKKGHIKDKCWLLHPHLKPAKFKTSRANLSQEITEGHELSPGNATPSAASTSKDQETLTAASSSFQGEVIKKADLDALITSLKSLRDSGICLYSQSLFKPVIVDSGASHHMISDPRLINNIRPALGNVVIANGARISVSGVGKLGLFNKKSKAFYMPEFTSNLLSVRKAVLDLGCYVIFGPNEVIFQDIKTGNILGQGSVKDGLYILEDSKFLSRFDNDSLGVSNSAVGSLSSFVWHARTGHPHTRALDLMLPNVSFNSLDCEACILGKHCRSVYPSSSTIYDQCFELVHSDVWTAPCS